ncbi:MAG TPA: sugar phosphate nucleotidyltransferase [Bacteroidales bacterium]|nr:sugar phosphate nucleotidyltransferase [Bacteroidales bacterium]
MKPTLLILAAGMGSRYGGLKQLDRLGPNGETIMDYSISYAIGSNFGKIVFVIRKNMETDFREIIIEQYKNQIEIDYVFQELDSLPDGFSTPADKVKPYGTAHAILTAKSAINEPFVVINADDFYGKEAFYTISNFLNSQPQDSIPTFAMVGYKLGNTLSENGGVSHGVCSVDSNNYLRSIEEITKIRRVDNTIQGIKSDGTTTHLLPEQIVSMNFWGFTPLFFDKLEELFIDFLKNSKQDITAEFQIPTVIHHLIKNNLAKIHVLTTNASWFGVTYKEDRPFVVEKLKTMS